MQPGYVSCSGCGRLFKLDSDTEMYDLNTHSCADQKLVTCYQVIIHRAEEVDDETEAEIQILEEVVRQFLVSEGLSERWVVSYEGYLEAR